MTDCVSRTELAAIIDDEDLNEAIARLLRLGLMERCEEHDDCYRLSEDVLVE